MDLRVFEKNSKISSFLQHNSAGQLFANWFGYVAIELLLELSFTVLQNLRLVSPFLEGRRVVVVHQHALSALCFPVRQYLCVARAVDYSTSSHSCWFSPFWVDEILLLVNQYTLSALGFSRLGVQLLLELLTTVFQSARVVDYSCPTYPR